MSNNSKHTAAAESYPSLTIAEAFERHVLPQLVRKGVKRCRQMEYIRAVREWDSFALNHWTICPGVQNVRTTHIVDWQTHLVENGKGARTTNKHTGAIHAVLKRCAALELIAKAPNPVDQLPCDKQAEDRFYLRWLSADEADELADLEVGTARPEDVKRRDELRQRDELARLYAACDCATWPRFERGRGKGRRELDPVAEWRAAIIGFSFYGFRTEELLAVGSESAAGQLKHKHLLRQRATPRRGGKVENAAGWLDREIPKTSRRHIVPLLPEFAAHIDRIRPKGQVDPERAVFYWPLTKGRPGEPAGVYPQFRRICVRAGLRPEKGEHYNLEDLRNTAVSWHQAEHGEGIAYAITGHAPRGIQNQHYNNNELAVVEAIRATRRPQIWHPADVSGTQQRLF